MNRGNGHPIRGGHRHASVREVVRIAGSPPQLIDPRKHVSERIVARAFLTDRVVRQHLAPDLVVHMVDGDVVAVAHGGHAPERVIFPGGVSPVTRRILGEQR
ncbi:hypothetical protein D3C85_476650 [compost metagenome]